jgi:thioredoxin-related protein
MEFRMSQTAPKSESIPWMTDLATAVKEARAQRKPILIDVFKDDCHGCDRLDEETFADPVVAEQVISRFIPLKLHLFRDREFARQWQVFWTPTVLFADKSGKVRYESPNFLPVPEFLDLLDIGEAEVAMRWKEYDKAIALLTGLEERSPDGALTAEAIYWRGIAAYFRDGNSRESGEREWRVLQERFPESIWAKRIP